MVKVQFANKSVSTLSSDIMDVYLFINIELVISACYWHLFAGVDILLPFYNISSRFILGEKKCETTSFSPESCNLRID